MSLDKAKVKRVFTFGCSFTRFIWPTWADIISHEFEKAEFYNFGLSGIGNLAISARIAEANNRFSFTENDLVMVLWSTYLREDRWLRGSWLRSGNVYNSSDIYDQDFIKKYTDICGYLIRDGALISMTELYLKQLPCQSVMMNSVPYDYLETDMQKEQKVYEDALKLYAPVFDRMPISLYEFLCKKHDKKEWPVAHQYYWEEFGTMHNDSHPSPIDAFDYINNHVVQLSAKTLQYTLESTSRLKKLKYKNQIVEEFSSDDKQNLLF